MCWQIFIFYKIIKVWGSRALALIVCTDNVSVFECLFFRPIHSADHRSGKAFQSWLLILYVVHRKLNTWHRNKWYKGKLKKKKKNIIVDRFVTHYLHESLGKVFKSILLYFLLDIQLKMKAGCFLKCSQPLAAVYQYLPLLAPQFQLPHPVQWNISPAITPSISRGTHLPSHFPGRWCTPTWSSMYHHPPTFKIPSFL